MQQISIFHVRAVLVNTGQGYKAQRFPIWDHVLFVQQANTCLTIIIQRLLAKFAQQVHFNQKKTQKIVKVAFQDILTPEKHR